MSEIVSESRIHFSFGSHGPDSINSIPLIRQELAEFFGSQPSNRLVFVREDSLALESAAKKMRRFLSQGYSITDATLLASAPASMVKRDPRSVVERARSGVAAQRQGFGIHLMDMLSGLSSEFIFEYQMENFPDFQANKMQQRNELAKKQGELALKTLIVEHNAPAGIRLYRDYIDGFAEVQRFRNNWYIQNIRQMLHQADTQNKPVSIFTRVGGYHAAILELADQDGSWKPYNPEITYSISASSQTLEAEVLKEFQLNPKAEVDDEVILRVILEGIIKQIYLGQAHNLEEASQKASAMVRRSTARELVAEIPKMQTGLSQIFDKGPRIIS